MKKQSLSEGRSANTAVTTARKDKDRGGPNSGESNVELKSTVLSLAKGFRVLEVFNGREPELNLSEIAQRADLDTGTAFRLIRTLVMLGYLEQVDGVKRYRLALKVIDLGFNAIARMDLHSLDVHCSALWLDRSAKLQALVCSMVQMWFTSIGCKADSPRLGSRAESVLGLRRTALLSATPFWLLPRWKNGCECSIRASERNSRQ